MKSGDTLRVNTNKVSPLVWGAWIEIWLPTRCYGQVESPLVWGAWIEIERK